MKEYEGFVDECFKNNSEKPFDNSSAEHATVLIKKMFEYGKTTINIYTGCLEDAVYGNDDLIEKAEKYLRNGGQLQIILQDQLTKESLGAKKFVQSCHNNNEKVVFYQLKEKYRDIVKNHFSTMDDTAFRLETDKDKKLAIACANNKEQCKIFNNIYSKLLDGADKIQFPPQQSI